MLSHLVDTRASYSEAHVIKTLMLLFEMPHGRLLLMKKLGLNEASARTLLLRLQSKGYSETSTYGHKLTKKGEKFIKRIKKKIIGPVEVEKTFLAVAPFNIAYIVKNAAKKIKYGLEQRDMAIKLGAAGLTTLIFTNKLEMPSVKKSIPKSLEKLFKVKKNDVILIGSAETQIIADLAALYTSYKLLLL